MLILTIRTDKPEAEIGLFANEQQLAYETWPAHRELAETIHLRIAELLKAEDYGLADIKGIVAFKGPGSFTGLRIGLSVANALAYSLGIPIVSTSGGSWVKAGIAGLKKGQDQSVALPEYGAPPHITPPRS